MTDREKESGGPQYGGNRGGESAGSEGGQGGKGEAEGESREERVDEQGGPATPGGAGRPKASGAARHQERALEG